MADSLNGAAGSGGRRPGAGRRAVVRGLRQRSPFVLVVAALLLGLFLLAVHYVFTSGAWSAVPLRVWMRADRATATSVYVSWAVGRLGADPPSIPMVYLLGGSTGREATIDDGTTLARSIAGEGGPSVGAVNLASPMQTFAHGLSIVDNLPEGSPTTVLIGVSPGRFTSGVGAGRKGSTAPGLFLWSDTLDGYLASMPGGEAGPRPIAQVAQTLMGTVKTDARGLWRGNLPKTRYVQHKWDSAAIKSEAALRLKAQQWVDIRSPQFEENVGFNLAMLEELTRRSEERGFDVVIVELPRNLDVIGDLWDEVDAGYQPQIRTIAENHGVSYLDFNHELALPSEAFFDTHHMRPQGRVVWEARLARALAEMYRRGALASSPQ